MAGTQKWNTQYRQQSNDTAIRQTWQIPFPFHNIPTWHGEQRSHALRVALRLSQVTKLNTVLTELWCKTVSGVCTMPVNKTNAAFLEWKTSLLGQLFKLDWTWAHMSALSLQSLNADLCLFSSRWLKFPPLIHISPFQFQLSKVKTKWQVSERYTVFSLSETRGLNNLTETWLSLLVRMKEEEQHSSSLKIEQTRGQEVAKRRGNSESPAADRGHSPRAGRDLCYTWAPTY